MKIAEIVRGAVKTTLANTRRHQTDRLWHKRAVDQEFTSEREMLALLYGDMTPTATGDFFDCTGETIKNRMRKRGIERRGPGGKNHKKHKT